MAQQIDLLTLSVDELKALQVAVQQELVRREKEARAEAIDKIRKLAEEAGLAPDEVAQVLSKSTRKVQKPRGPVAPQYRSPEGDEWSGRGRVPTWLMDLVPKGKRKEDFKEYRIWDDGKTPYERRQEKGE